MTESSEGETAIKRYALGKVTFEDGLFIHTGHTFFTKEGAEKQLPSRKVWSGREVIPLTIIADIVYPIARCLYKAIPPPTSNGTV